MKLEGLTVLRLNQVKIWNDKESKNYDWKDRILKYKPKINKYVRRLNLN